MRPREQLTASAGAAALALAVFAIGGVPRWALVGVALLLAVAVSAQLGARRRLARVSPLVAVLALGVGLTALQAIPLPPAIDRALAPVGAALVTDSRAFTDDAEAWRPLSKDPPGTWRALLTGLALLAAAVVALRLAATERGRYRLLALVGGLAGLTVAVVAVHQVLGLSALYGVYEPEQASTRLLGPLLNPNHLGSFLAVGALVTLGLAMFGRQPTPARVAWLVVSMGCVVALLATRSRGAAIAVAAGGLVTVGVVVLQRAVRAHGDRPPGRASPWTTVPIAVAVACAFALVVAFSGAGTGAELDRTTAAELDEPTSKFAAWRAARTLVAESPWLGVGRGGFEPAFTRVFAPSSVGTFSHLENEYLQAVVDWGVPGAGAIAVAMAWLVVMAVRRWRDGPLAAGALGALAAVAVQSVVDFGLAMPGLALTVVVVAATVSYVPLHDGRGEPVRRRRQRLAMRLALVVALGLGAVLVAPAWGRSVGEDHRVLGAGRPTLAQALATLRRHPLDYLAAGTAAQAAMREGDARAVRLLNHALALHPTHAGLHREAARLLVRNRLPAQAAIEYASAARGALVPGPITAEIARAFPDDALALRALPVMHRVPLAIATALEEAGRPALALAYLEQVVAARPEQARVVAHLLTLADEHGAHAVAERVARRQLALQPTLARRLVLARLLERRGDHAGVRRELADVASLRGDLADRLAAWNLACNAAWRLGELAEARACFTALAASDVVTPRTRALLEARLTRLAADERAAARAAP